MSSRSRHPRFLLPLAPLVAALGLAPRAAAQLGPDWITRLPFGSTLSAGPTAMIVDAAGTTYVTGNAGTSNDNDVLTAAFTSDGNLLWQRTYDGPAHWHDQGRGIAFGPNGTVWVTGNTPGPGSYANVLLLAYDALSGALLKETIYSSGPFTSEYGGSVLTDRDGNVYVGGGTVGDGADGMLLKFDADGAFLWKRVWDGPAFAPYSQDQILELAMDPEGHVDALVYGVMASNQPDYVVLEYGPEGSVLWQANWGTNGNEEPSDMVLDAAGDVFVTGSAIGSIATISLRGSDGGFVWQAYDSPGARNGAIALALDGLGSVYVTGKFDPDGDRSNNNDNLVTLKRSAIDGALAWTQLYGANCVNCFDGPSDVIVDPAGFVFVAGVTASPPYGGDLILFVLDPATGLELRRGVLSGGPSEVLYPGRLAFDGAHALYDGGQAYDANTGAVDLALIKTHSLRETQYALDVTPLLAGGPATFTVVHGTPLASQFVVYGLGGLASAPYPVLGTTLSLAGPKLLFWGVADASGTLARTLTVPAGTAGVPIWFQALELHRASTAPSSHGIR